MQKRDLTGQRFGRLTVVERGGRTPSGRNVMWRCRCDCGQERTVVSSVLTRGESASCGCLRREASKARATKHGHATGETSRTYNSWACMWQRCTNPEYSQYGRYGGRGISVCERWSSFTAFLADMGERPEGRTLDRINTNGNYEPNNCRWATPKEQTANRNPRKDARALRGL